MKTTFTALLLGTVLFPGILSGQETKKPEKEPAGQKAELVPLNKGRTVLLDMQNKRLLLKTKVTLREGTLEMLCCIKQTKEHESILALDGKAYVVHTGLLVLKANPGSPVSFTPKYTPATGQKIDVFLNWTDKEGVAHRVPAQKWMRHTINRFYGFPMEKLPADLKIPEESELRYDTISKELSWYAQMTKAQRDELLKLSTDAEYKKAINSFYERSQISPMKAHWVFAGSGFSQDDDGNRAYLAEGGDLICVANFPTATLDIQEESSSSGEGNLLYEAWTERIPPLGTEVTLELIPVKPTATKKPADKPADSKEKE